MEDNKATIIMIQEKKKERKTRLIFVDYTQQTFIYINFCGSLQQPVFHPSYI